jgi:SAM-dependent methyltransferase
VFAAEGSPVFMIGAFESALAAGRIAPRLTEAFLTGRGVGWHEHDHLLFHGVERFFSSGYTANLVQSWIPALEGVEAKLRAGAHVADIGCGHGASTILMAQAYPNSSFIGFDYHQESIAAARKRAIDAGVANRVRFEVATAKDYPGSYDLVTIFDALHDLGDPIGAAAHVRATLKPGGAWLIVEPYAEDRVEANLHPIGRAYYSGSTLMCTPNSLNQEVGLALGAQAGEARLRAVLSEGGFSRVRRATQTPFNLVLEARP